MSRLAILHDTIYRYRRPVSFGPHRLVLRPREGHDVDVVSMRVSVSPSFELRWARDVFNNSIATVVLTEPADELHIRSDVLLDRASDADEPHDVMRPAGYPVAYPPLEAPLAAVYLIPSFAEDAEALRAFLFDEVGLAREGDVSTTLPRLNAEIHRRIRYRRREQKGVQSPAETLSLGTGSCRDLATLLVESARVLGVAARFVSGYLDCAASAAGRASTHAWAEVYLPDAGWCGFDPTLAESTSHKHVVVAVSSHPRGVMPVSGSFTGAPGDYLGLEVKVAMTTV
jgi:transglutaminase-like putative cysteine protease